MGLNQIAFLNFATYEYMIMIEHIKTSCLYCLSSFILQEFLIALYLFIFLPQYLRWNSFLSASFWAQQHL